MAKNAVSEETPADGAESNYDSRLVITPAPAVEAFTNAVVTGAGVTAGAVATFFGLGLLASFGYWLTGTAPDPLSIAIVRMPA